VVAGGRPVVVVVEGEDLEDAVGIDVVGAPDGVDPVVLAPELAPGCSLATMTPINAVAPVATRTAKRVRLRKRTLARSRDSGELSWLGRFTVGARPVALRSPS
jgi:hypothetical protein